MANIPQCDECKEFNVHEEFDWYDMLPGQFVGGWLCDDCEEKLTAAYN